MKKKVSLAVIMLLVVSLVLMTGCGGGGTSGGGDSGGGAASGGGEPAGGGDTPSGGGDTPAGGGGGESVTIRIGAGTGADNPMATFMDRFKEYAERESGGRITVEIYPFGQLGTNAQMIQAVSDGSVEMYLVPSNYWGAIVPEINAATLPGLFDDSDHAVRALKTDQENIFEPIFNAAGITNLGWCFLNDYILASNKDMSTIDNLAGQKIWSNPGASFEGFLAGMGATPSLVDVGEMTSGLQNGTFDGTFGGMSLFKPFTIQSVCDYLYKGPTIVGLFPVMANLDWLNSLPEDLKAIVVDGSRIISYDGYDNYNSIYEYAGLYQIEAIELVIADGMTVIDPSEADWVKMRAVMDNVTETALSTNPSFQPYYDKLLPLAEATR